MSGVTANLSFPGDKSQSEPVDDTLRHLARREVSVDDHPVRFERRFVRQ